MADSASLDLGACTALHPLADAVGVSSNCRELFRLGHQRGLVSASDLPFSVDLLDRSDASTEFLSRLKLGGMVELPPLPAAHA